MHYRFIAILIWIPEIFARYYELKKINLEDTNICTASEGLMKYHSNNKVEAVSANAYFAAVLVTMSTIPLVVITGILIKYVNKKFLLCTYILYLKCQAKHSFVGLLA